MSKKCISCGVVWFVSDESCKRCGSVEFIVDDSTDTKNKLPEKTGKSLSGWSYVKCFFLAVLIEVVALASGLPAVAAGIGTRHSANAPPSNEPLIVISERAFFILHLPTILFTLPFKNSRLPIIFLTPLGQIIFFTCLFAYIARRKQKHLE
jgi:hypothetical protein